MTTQKKEYDPILKLGYQDDIFIQVYQINRYYIIEVLNDRHRMLFQGQSIEQPQLIIKLKDIQMNSAIGVGTIRLKHVIVTIDTGDPITISVK